MSRSERVEISDELRTAIRRSGLKQYVLAQRADVDRSVLSAWLCGISRVRANDARVIALGEIVGVEPANCFANR